MRNKEDDPGQDDLYRQWESSEHSDIPQGVDWEDSYQAIVHRIGRARHRRRMAVRAIGAVCLLLAVAGVYQYMHTPGTASRKDLLASVETIANQTDSLQAVYLKDSTLVQLYPHSVLSFNAAYNQTDRQLLLLGIAGFKVHKDPQKPFTVHTDHLSVKAIGTEFRVSNRQRDSIESVWLEEGVVQVDLLNGAQQPRILAVRDLLVLNRADQSIAISNDGARGKTLARTADSKTKKHGYPASVLSGAKWFAFDNTALPAIFDQLSVIYGCTIRYDKKELKNMLFIGKFDKKDSLDHILGVITSLNNLRYDKIESGIYEIKK